MRGKELGIKFRGQERSGNLARRPAVVNRHNKPWSIRLISPEKSFQFLHVPAEDAENISRFNLLSGEKNLALDFNMAVHAENQRHGAVQLAVDNDASFSREIADAAGSVDHDRAGPQPANFTVVLYYDPAAGRKGTDTGAIAENGVTMRRNRFDGAVTPGRDRARFDVAELAGLFASDRTFGADMPALTALVQGKVTPGVDPFNSACRTEMNVASAGNKSSYADIARQDPVGIQGSCDDTARQDRGRQDGNIRRHDVGRAASSEFNAAVRIDTALYSTIGAGIYKRVAPD